MAVIESITPFTLPYVEPNDHGATRYICLVRVVDSDGVEGWGEAVTLFKEATWATEAMLRGYSELLIGVLSDPAIAAERLQEHGWWYADAGIACFASSAIDLALWDIAGKRANLPLLAMLGVVHNEMRTVVTCHATDADLLRMAGRMASIVREKEAIGIKVGFGKRGDANLGFDHDRDVRFVSELRSALGSESLVMIDIGAKIKWSSAEAIERILAFERYGVHWTEEPLGADNPLGYRALKEATHSLIAYGEREWTPHGYAKIIDTDTVDVIGIDPGRAGGITGFLAALKHAESAGIQANAHAFAGPITFAASLALSQSSSACRQLEQMPEANGLYDLIHGAPVAEHGRVRSSDRPGLGLTVDRDAITAIAEATRVG